MQPSIFDVQPSFSGPELTPADTVRLSRHLQTVRDLMADGRWRTLQQIAGEVGCSEASASARLRDLRHQKHGAYTVNKKRVSAGLWIYQVIA